MTRSQSLLFWSTLLAAGCAIAHERGTKEALIRTDQAWSAAASEGKDVEKVVAFWSDDAMLVPPGSRIVSGKDALRAFVAHSFAEPGTHFSWTTLDAVVSDDGTLGYTTGENTLTRPGPDGKLATSTGRAIAVWRWQDGAWKCVYDTWNHGPAVVPLAPK